MFAIGADVEHGVYHNNKLISVIDIVPGEKSKPYPLKCGGGLQVDNVLLEWNAPVSYSEQEFVDNILGVQYEINMMFPEFTLGYESSYIYEDSELKDKRAWIIGCESDFNAWMMETIHEADSAVNPTPDFFLSPNFRSAGGHIHTSGYQKPEESIQVLRYMDLYLGIPSLFLDSDQMRRQLYGKAGACRFKQYPNGAGGCEYRTLGAFWTKDEFLIRWVYKTAKKIFDNVLSGEELPLIPPDVQDVINNYDLHKADQYMKEFNLWP